MKTLNILLLCIWSGGGTLHLVSILTGRGTGWTWFWLALSTLGILWNAFQLLRVPASSSASSSTTGDGA